MFHHFHDDKHEPAQGSLSKTDFKNMVHWLGNKYSLLGANEYTEKCENGTLNSSDICLSFDDALKCQYDVAVAVMNEIGIDAFFFVYSSVFTANPDYLEIYRYFRTSTFDDIDEFYEEFFEISQQYHPKFSKHKTNFIKLNYLSDCPFYSENDIWFRYLRSQHLSLEQYQRIMSKMMSVKKFDTEKAKKHLWMTEDDLINIHQSGHIVGLHSYSHPIQMKKISRSKQKIEYQKNYEHLVGITGNPIKAMSHPCGEYNQDTLEILKAMGISIGFRSSMSTKDIKSSLEIPREDHANVFKEM